MLDHENPDNYYRTNDVDCKGFEISSGRRKKGYNGAKKKKKNKKRSADLRFDFIVM